MPKKQQTRKFATLDLLTVTTQQGLCRLPGLTGPRLFQETMSIVIDITKFIVGSDVWYHPNSWGADERMALYEKAANAILEQHPDLQEATPPPPGSPEEEFDTWRDVIEQQYGKKRTITRS